MIAAAAAALGSRFIFPLDSLPGTRRSACPLLIILELFSICVGWMVSIGAYETRHDALRTFPEGEVSMPGVRYQWGVC